MLLGAVEEFYEKITPLLTPTDDTEVCSRPKLGRKSKKPSREAIMEEINSGNITLDGLAKRFDLAEGTFFNFARKYEIGYRNIKRKTKVYLMDSQGK